MSDLRPEELPSEIKSEIRDALDLDRSTQIRLQHVFAWAQKKRSRLGAEGYMLFRRQPDEYYFEYLDGHDILLATPNNDFSEELKALDDQVEPNLIAA